MKHSKRILVTGGAGFIGSHLCKRLIDKGNDVICIDNFYTGNEKNITHLRANKRFQMIQHDISCPIHFSMDVDEIYHLACPASPRYYQRDPIQTMKINVIGTLEMLELAKRNQAKFLLASTSEVYGNPLVHPQKEDYTGNVNITGPRACYDEGKRCAETLTFDFNRKYGLNIRVVRIFNTYGPNMSELDGRVVSNFIVQAIRGQEITIYGDGKQTRSFCYIDDLIEGIIRMMNTNDDFQGPINLGNPEEFRIVDLAQMVIRLTKSSSRVIHKALPVDDPIQRKPDISLAKKQLNWEPKVLLEEGLLHTIKFFKNSIDG